MTLGLSPREGEIVKAVLDDQSEAQIATQLCLSVHTVHSHVARIYRKLHLNSRPQLIIRIFEEYVSLHGAACPDSPPDRPSNRAKKRLRTVEGPPAKATCAGDRRSQY